MQAKLRVNQPGDQDEQEADRVADQVMRLATPTLQRSCGACSVGETTCQTCDDEKKELVQRKAAGPGHSSGPSVRANFLSDLGSGQPLDRATRSLFEPQFGYDFSHVRVHTDAKAAASARAVNALAFTLGRDVVFDQSQYAPETYTGRRLLAHELTHVIQQSNSGSELTVQRACGPGEIGATPPDCSLMSQQLGERRYLFNRECDQFAPGEELRLVNDLAVIPPGTTVSIIGAASSDGDLEFNTALSCARARAAELTILGAPNAPTITSVEAVGPQGSANDTTFRAVSLDFAYPSPTSPVPPAGPPGRRVDQGIYLPVLPNNPASAFAACQVIPPVAPAVCGTAFTGLPCPNWYCRPFPTVAIARECRDKSAPILLAGITAAVRDTRVAGYWNTFLRGGTSGQVDMSTTFGFDFASDPASLRAALYLGVHLESYLRSAAPTLFVGPGPWTIDFSSVLLTEIANLETAGHAQEMVFAPPTTIPGLLAGGVALNQAACAAGLVPSAFNDHRRATVSATVSKTASGFQVTPLIDFRVEDTIDFCPGNCGTGAALGATVLLSRLEASGVSGDVPFLVDYSLAPTPFTI